MLGGGEKIGQVRRCVCWVGCWVCLKPCVKSGRARPARVRVCVYTRVCEVHQPHDQSISATAISQRRRRSSSSSVPTPPTPLLLPPLLLLLLLVACGGPRGAHAVRMSVVAPGTPQAALEVGTYMCLYPYVVICLVVYDG